MYLVALRLTTNREDACDAVQDALVNLWQHRSRLPEAAKIKAYAMTAARNAAVSIIRRRHLYTPIEESEDDIHDMAREIDARDRFSLVMNIIDDLPRGQRSVIMLRDIEGREYDDIVSLTGLSHANVRTLLSRARNVIRNHFKL